MTERKPWTEEQDNALRYLRQDQRISKWSTIAQKMADDYKMTGRSGKQCRERYHNHLDASIVKTSWCPQEEVTLFRLHDQIGNKWAVIAQDLPGRTDNCVKNHFYSKLRKSLRKLNKIIHDHYRKEFKEIKTTALYKIIEANEERHKKEKMADQELMEFCLQLKNRLLNFSDDNQVNTYEGSPDLCHQLARDVHQFSRQYKRQPKKPRKSSGDFLKVQQPIRPRVRSTENALDYSDDYSGSYYESDLSDRSRMDENEDEEEEIGLGEKLNSRTKSDIVRPSQHYYSNGFNGNLFAPPGFMQFSEYRVTQNFYPNLMNNVPEQQKRAYSSCNPQATSFKMTEEGPENIEDVLKNDGILQNDDNWLPGLTLSKGQSNFSKVSNQPHQHLFFDDTQFQIKTFGYNPYGNVKQISMTDKILQE